MIEAFAWVWGWVAVPLYFLMENPFEQAAIVVLRAVLLVVSLVCGVRMVLAQRSLVLLRRRCAPYPPDDVPVTEGAAREPRDQLLRCLRSAQEKTGTSQRTVRLRRFPDLRPLVFLAGPRGRDLFLSLAVVERLSRDELEALLVHELLHARRRDPLRSCVGGLLLAPCFGLVLVLATIDVAFLATGSAPTALVASLLAPLLVGTSLILGRRVESQLEKRREYACDRSTVERLGSPWSLLGALREVLRLGRGLQEFPWGPGRVALLRRASSSQERIERLARHQLHGRRRRALARATQVSAALAFVALSGLIVHYHWLHRDPQWSQTGHPGWERPHLCSSVCRLN